MPLDPEPEPAEKNASSETDTSERARSLPLPTLGGGVTITCLPRVGPLEMVTGDPPRTRDGNPSPGLAPLARVRADANSSSRSVIEPLRLNNEFPLLG